MAASLRPVWLSKTAQPTSRLVPYLYSASGLTTRPSKHGFHRSQSTLQSAVVEIPGPTTASATKGPLSRLTTTSLLRSIFLGTLFTKPRLLKFLMGRMNWVIQSKSPLLNPDKNMVLRGIVRALIYDHFCAGSNAHEVRKSVAEFKAMGYSGVILGYGREIIVDTDAKANPDAKSAEKAGEIEEECIAQWLEGNMTTLSLIGPGDFMNIKFTGAGPSISKCLIDGTPPPEQFRAALATMCAQAAAQQSCIWIDAEQQVYQRTIDAWAVDLMRQHNRDGRILIYNTIQTYLKSARATVGHQLALAQREGWTLALKQVRGAYIASDTRSAIWPTKPETDANYNGIAHDLLSQNYAAFPGVSPTLAPPAVQLFLAGHNRDSIQRATRLVTDLVAQGRAVTPVAYGQLAGMADDISCELVARSERVWAMDTTGMADAEVARQRLAAPRVYKCLNWGTVSECMHFLMRRAVENASAAERIKDGLVELRAELWRRILRR